MNPTNESIGRAFLESIGDRIGLREKDILARARDFDYEAETARGHAAALEAKKSRARRLVRRAVQRGDLVRPTDCSRCGVILLPHRNGCPQIQGHHEDYDKPLDVVWLCSACHREETPNPSTYGAPNIGVKNGCSKLTEDEVREIRRIFTGKDRPTYQEVATQFDVDRKTVERIVKRTQWAHVPDLDPHPPAQEQGEVLDTLPDAAKWKAMPLHERLNIHAEGCALVCDESKDAVLSTHEIRAMHDDIREAVATLTRAAGAEDARDEERLDWLESFGSMNIVHWYRPGKRSCVELVDHDDDHIAEGETLRAAIDAAIASQAKEGEG